MEAYLECARTGGKPVVLAWYEVKAVVREEVPEVTSCSASMLLAIKCTIRHLK